MKSEASRLTGAQEQFKSVLLLQDGWCAGKTSKVEHLLKALL